MSANVANDRPRVTRRELRLARKLEEARANAQNMYIDAEESDAVPHNLASVIDLDYLRLDANDRLNADERLHADASHNGDSSVSAVPSAADANDVLAEADEDFPTEKIDAAPLVSRALGTQGDGGTVRFAAGRFFAHGRNRVLSGVAAAAVVACGVGIGSFGSGQDAQADVVTASILKDVKQNVSQTPDSLSEKEHADYLARLKETEAAATSGVDVDKVENSASLLAGFVDTSDRVYIPMAAGTYKLVSPFGMRIHPVYHTPRMHNGVDMAGPAGTPLYAVADGVVLKAGAGGQSGINNAIVIEHEVNGEVFTTWYLHEYDDGMFVKVGDHVTAGQIIGAVGSQGVSTGAHLHFEAHPGAGLDTKPVDPLVYIKSLGARDISAK